MEKKTKKSMKAQREKRHSGRERENDTETESNRKGQGAEGVQRTKGEKDGGRYKIISFFPPLAMPPHSSQLWHYPLEQNLLLLRTPFCDPFVISSLLILPVPSLLWVCAQLPQKKSVSMIFPER
jgi:hypothetical protein